LRQFASGGTGSDSSSNSIMPLARFTPHRTPITSVEWHPTDESMLAVTDSVGTYIYDLSVEEDDTGADPNINNDIPPQLLFVHCGSEQFKEVHWHPQITSCLMTTALT
jgi:ribosome assembly protein RRB1